jgi:hypothetical protein
MKSAVLQSLLVAIEAAGQQVPPQADAAFPAAEQTRIPSARVFGGTRETTQQSSVSRFQRLRDVPIANAKQPQHARRFFAEDVTGGRRRDPFAGEQHDPLGSLGWKSGECPAVGTRQTLAAGNPAGHMAAF